MIGDINHDKHNNISDHDTLVIEKNYDNKETEEEHKQNFCSTRIPLYNTEEICPGPL